MEYWDRRYAHGGTSGLGSVGKFRDWKWSVIEQEIAPIDDVIDVGCGDLTFWQNRKRPDQYTGIDISETIINRNRKVWPGANFICSSADVELQLKPSRIVFCLDVLFHIMDEETYCAILNNLASYSREWIFVYTWSRNPFISTRSRIQRAIQYSISGHVHLALRQLRDKSSDGLYQKYRHFDEYHDIFLRRGFELHSKHNAWELNDIGSLYCFRKHSD